MLYAIEGKQLDGDPYDIGLDPCHRDHVKTALYLGRRAIEWLHIHRPLSPPGNLRSAWHLWSTSAPS